MKIFHWMKYGKQTNLNSLQLNGTKLGPRFARASHNEHRHKFQSVLTKDYTQFFFSFSSYNRAKKKTCTPSFWTKYKRAPNAKYALCLLEYRYRVIMCENCVYFLFSTVSISHSRSTDLSQCVLLD